MVQTVHCSSCSQFVIDAGVKLERVTEYCAVGSIVPSPEIRTGGYKGRQQQYCSVMLDAFAGHKSREIGA